MWKKIYILGDITDSTFTFSPGDNPNIHETNTESCRKFNIKNLKAINDNEKIKAIFGNRDLLKINLKYGFKLKKSDDINLSITIDTFNNGNVTNFQDVYTKLKDTAWEWENDGKYFVSFTKHTDKIFGVNHTFRDRLQLIVLDYGIPVSFMDNLIPENTISEEFNQDPNYKAFVTICIWYVKKWYT